MRAKSVQLSDGCVIGESDRIGTRGDAAALSLDRAAQNPSTLGYELPWAATDLKKVVRKGLIG